MIMRLGCSFLWCTISVYNKKPASIYDAWEGPYFAPMNWKKVSPLLHESTWFSSLDYQRKQEAVHLVEYGNIDQSATYFVRNNWSSLSQRPALYHIHTL